MSSHVYETAIEFDVEISADVSQGHRATHWEPADPGQVEVTGITIKLPVLVFEHGKWHKRTRKITLPECLVLDLMNDSVLARELEEHFCEQATRETIEDCEAALEARWESDNDR